MATRSRIGIVNEDGTVSSIYCHWDGYVRGVGSTLVNHYTDRDKVKRLIALGSISSLRERVEPYNPLKGYAEGKAKDILERLNPAEEHSFDRPAEGVTVAYGRDRGEEGEPIVRVNKSVAEYFQDDNEEYGYLFSSEGEWLVLPVYGENSKIEPVIQYLAEDES